MFLTANPSISQKSLVNTLSSQRTEESTLLLWTKIVKQLCLNMDTFLLFLLKISDLWEVPVVNLMLHINLNRYLSTLICIKEALSHSETQHVRQRLKREIRQLLLRTVESEKSGVYEFTKVLFKQSKIVSVSIIQLQNILSVLSLAGGSNDVSQLD